MNSFETLKEKLVKPRVLTLPRPYLSYLLDTEVNADQIGAVLMENQPDNTLKQIRYFSKTLTDTEKNYDTTGRECLAISCAVKLLRPYLEGHHFTLRTYHGPLMWLFGPKVTSARLASWRLRLQEFEFTVEHLPGNKHLAADAMT